MQKQKSNHIVILHEWSFLEKEKSLGELIYYVAHGNREMLNIFKYTIGVRIILS